MGELVPMAVMETVPGDVWQMQTENVIRFAPLLAPIMHKINIKVEYFYVPNRLLWANWEDFITGTDDSLVPPYIDSWNGITENSLGCYMGLPTANADSNLKASALPFAAYKKIWNDWYRDENLQVAATDLFEPLIDGNNTATDLFLDIIASPRKRAWEHDYFTSCLPFAQKGDAVTLPLTNEGTIPVTHITGQGPTQFVDPATGNPRSLGFTGAVAQEMTTGNLITNSATGVLDDTDIDPNGSLGVTLNAEAASINTLRRAFQLQKWLELNARGGTRYIEQISAHFGVRSSDARLQRAEHIGTSVGKVKISEVMSNTETVDSSDAIVSPVGAYTGHAIAAQQGNRFTYRTEEHGWIIGIISCTPKTAYQQGLHKSFSRETALDYYWPSFQHIGEQEVKKKELFTGNVAQLDETFGYIPRYSEYKFLNSRVSGELIGNLDFWHLGRIFTSVPSLNSTFITANPDRRIFAVTDSNVDTLYCHQWNSIRVKRKMAYYGNPM